MSQESEPAPQDGAMDADSGRVLSCLLSDLCAFTMEAEDEEEDDDSEENSSLFSSLHEAPSLGLSSSQFI